MATVIWSTFAVGILIAIFAGCVIVVAAGIRLPRTVVRNGIGAPSPERAGEAQPMAAGSIVAGKMKFPAANAVSA